MVVDEPSQALTLPVKIALGLDVAHQTERVAPAIPDAIAAGAAAVVVVVNVEAEIGSGHVVVVVVVAVEQGEILKNHHWSTFVKKLPFCAVVDLMAHRSIDAEFLF